MAFQIRDLVNDVWFEEGDRFLYAGCTQPSCGKSSDDGDGDDKGGHPGDQKGDEKKGSKPKYAPYAPEAGLALLQQQLRQSLAQEL